ncbi:MAG: hypothetical protein P8M71_03755 [Pseudomonadales bacterium]|nr:hypothetical protein [Pseudomonadales bacterium]
MAKGFKTGGRTKGTPNRDKQALRERLSSLYPDYDPILAMVEMANDEALEPSMRLDCHKTIANYIHPKMRSIEHIIEDEPQPINITIVKPESTSEPRITLQVIDLITLLVGNFNKIVIVYFMYI